MSVPSWCRVGAKVVCVDQIVVPADEPTPDPPRPNWVYTIAAIRMFGKKPSIQLEEIPALGIGLTEDGRYWENSSWWALMVFRPVTESDNEVESRIYRKRGLGVGPILDRLDRLRVKLDEPERTE